MPFLSFGSLVQQGSQVCKYVDMDMSIACTIHARGLSAPTQCLLIVKSHCATQAAAEDNDQEGLQLGEPFSSGDDHRQAPSGSLQHAENDGAAAAVPSRPPAATPDLRDAKPATAGEAGDTGAAAGAAADAVLGSTAGSVASSGCARDSAEGTSRSFQVGTSAVMVLHCGNCLHCVMCISPVTHTATAAFVLASYRVYWQILELVRVDITGCVVPL